ncbi:MAG: terpene cyclase/mutase family protein [Planctomycetaceae bacterium]|nr:terpene cyclase/mutase family protein [Planctomycetaceae bacterium]
MWILICERRGYSLLSSVFVSLCVIIHFCCVVAVNAHAQDAIAAPAETAFQKDEIDIAMDKAIAYLVSKQRDDGAIIDKGHDTTMTALSIMAMASVGIQPADPTPEGQAMSRALAFVLREDRVDDKGYFGRADGSRMYGHGIITLMLTEMLGMGASPEQDQLIHDRCQKAIDVILSSQKERKPTHYRGGWRYEPHSKDSDLSATVWQLMALRSARNDGMQVPASAIADAVEYLKRSYTSPLDRNGLPEKKAGGFSYEPHQNNPTFTMTAAGLLAMQVCGEYDSPFVIGAADWLLERPPKWEERFCSYGTYYYAQGMYQRGGEHAETARRLVQEMLLAKQAEDGSWTAHNGSEKGVGAVYATSMAVLSLSVKYHYLPIYQK